MMKSRESGSTFWGMIVFIALTLVFAVLWYQESSRVQDLQTKASTASSSASAAQEETAKIKAKLFEILDVTGFVETGADGYPDLERMKTALQGYKAELPAMLQLEYDASKYTPTGDGGKIEEVGQGKKVVTYLLKSEANGIKTLESVFPQFKTAAQRMTADITRAFTEIDTQRTQKAAAEAAHKTALQTKDTEISNLTAQLEQQRAQASQQQQEQTDRITGLTSQLETATTDLENERNERAAEVTALRNDLNEQLSLVKVLNERNRPMLSEGPDGDVLAAGNGRVVVNRGKADQLMPGTVFSVLRRIKGGSLVPVGTIRVTSCDEDTANCSIVESTTAFLPGDLVQSLTFSPKEVLHFAFVGEFRKMGRGDAMSRMKALGAMVDEKVLPTTSYLVVGTPGPGVESIEETPAFRAAKEFGITVITEEMLASFTRY